jgi:hypothetical protein
VAIDRITNAKSGINLKVNLSAKDAQAILASLAKRFENIQQASDIDVDIKNLKGVGELLTQLKTLDQTMTALLDNSKITGKELSENISASINGVISSFQHGNELSNAFLNELNEIANITDKSQIPEKINGLVDKMNLGFSKLGLATKINAQDILNLGGTKEQLTSLANYITQFASSWGA